MFSRTLHKVITAVFRYAEQCVSKTLSWHSFKTGFMAMGQRYISRFKDISIPKLHLAPCRPS